MAGLAPALFITGTDTGVGKTWVGAALATLLTRRGMRVGVLKPVETGWPADPARAERETDGALLKRAADDPDPLERIVPFRYAEPLAPAVAARRSGCPVEIDVVGRVLEAKRAAFDVVLVEGAGGLLVPIADGVSTLDLVVHLRLPVLVVAGNRLGVINHTLLTVECAGSAGLAVVGVLLNEVSPEAPDLARLTNAEELARLLGARWLGHLPHRSGASGDCDGRAEIEGAVRLDALLEHLL